jgi:hypothetical protein
MIRVRPKAVDDIFREPTAKVNRVVSISSTVEI